LIAAELQNSFSKKPIDLGFWSQRLYIGGEAESGVDRGPTPPPGMARRGGTPPASMVGPWSPSGSPSVFVLCPGKIGGSGFVLSNSENISCVTFLKHKNSRN
jgi:hypothetical protein